MDNNTEHTQDHVSDITADELFNAAFDQMVNSLENPTATNATNASTDNSGTGDVNGSAQTNNVDSDSGQLQQNESNTPVVNTVEDTNPLQTNASQDNGVDYKALYEATQQHLNATTGLLNSRLAELSNKYQELKATASAPQVDQEPTEDIQVLSEVKEIYPEIYKAIEIMLQKELGSTKKSVEDMVAQSVQPIRQHLQVDAQQTHVQRILDKHADAHTLLNSGALGKWVDSLDSTKQIGAHMILKHGTPDQVINLISDYKSTLGTTPNTVQTKPQQQTTSTQSQQTLPSREEEIAKRVMQMLSVPGKTQDVTITQTSNAQTPTSTDYDTMLKQALAALDKK